MAYYGRLVSAPVSEVPAGRTRMSEGDSSDWGHVEASSHVSGTWAMLRCHGNRCQRGP